MTVTSRPATEPAAPPARLTPTLTAVLAATCAICAANIYFAQPLLRAMALGFGASETAAAPVAWMAQLGYAIGILIFVPLGDVVDPRKVMLALVAGLVAAAVLTGVAPNLTSLIIASLAVGTFAPVAQVIVPFAAGLSDPSSRGRVLGTLQAGLILGIVSGRTFSGLIATVAGWRAVYLVAAGVCALLFAVLARLLPAKPPPQPVRLMELWPRLPRLFLQEPTLRLSCLTGGLVSAAFAAFWTTLVFRVAAPPYHYGAAQAGMFGLLGVLAAVAAAPIGRVVDACGADVVNAAAAGIGLVGYAAMVLAGHWLGGLVIGAIAVDIAVQANQISNQTRIFAIPSQTHGRLNTVYMVCRFSGMAIGAFLGVLAWNAFGWIGVCGFGLAALTLALGMALRRLRVGTSPS